ncbi:MAG: DNA-binding GntR family transcriptional regulator [Alteromonadaceae bacterium]|jgi:DNA-binding GntR family transcriptional regulator
MSSKVTDTIKQDLAHQIQTQSVLPFKLTLGAIAEHYSVSLTPVRQVVESLVEEQMLIRKPNGRLERAKAPSEQQIASAQATVQKPINLNSDLDQLLTNHIVQLSLQSHSKYLREEATAKKYDTGRTIMRQVFSRLAGAGLIEHVPRCGWKVRIFREKDMLDYLEIREILEIKALNLARPHFRQHELQQMLDGNVSSNDPGSVELDNSLHNYWIDRCDNWYIQDFFSRHGAFFSALFDYAALGKNIKTEMAQEHRDILQNLVDQNWEGAEQALVNHIHDQNRNVLELVEFKNQMGHKK